MTDILKIGDLYRYKHDTRNAIFHFDFEKPLVKGEIPLINNVEHLYMVLLDCNFYVLDNTDEKLLSVITFQNYETASEKHTSCNTWITPMVKIAIGEMSGYVQYVLLEKVNT